MKTKEIIESSKVEAKIAALKELGNRIVLTQGVFDMYHVGHLRYLKKAKQEGDVLIVGLDSDELTKSRKGPQRPVVPEDERAELLLGVDCIDFVIIRELNADIDYLAKQVQPDVLIISNSTKDFPNFEQEMKNKMKDYCKEVICFDAQATTSTSAKIAKVVQAGNIEKLQELSSDLNEVFKKHGLTFQENGNGKK